MPPNGSCTQNPWADQPSAPYAPPSSRAKGRLAGPLPSATLTGCRPITTPTHGMQPSLAPPRFKQAGAGDVAMKIKRRARFGPRFGPPGLPASRAVPPRWFHRWQGGNAQGWCRPVFRRPLAPPATAHRGIGPDARLHGLPLNQRSGPGWARPRSPRPTVTTGPSPAPRIGVDPSCSTATTCGLVLASLLAAKSVCSCAVHRLAAMDQNQTSIPKPAVWPRAMRGTRPWAMKAAQPFARSSQHCGAAFGSSPSSADRALVS